MTVPETVDRVGVVGVALLTASSGGDQTLSTAAIGLFTLVATVVTMYLIARGSRRRDED